MADIKVRVGQQNSIKIVSSISGASIAGIAENVIGGIASVSQLYVSGISTFVGISTFKSNVYVDTNLYVGGDLYVNDDINFDEFNARNGNIRGSLIVGEEFYYQTGAPYAVAYFDQSQLLVSTGSTSLAIDETNYVLTTNQFGVPTWSKVIDGGFY